MLKAFFSLLLLSLNITSHIFFPHYFVICTWFSSKLNVLVHTSQFRNARFQYRLIGEPCCGFLPLTHSTDLLWRRLCCFKCQETQEEIVGSCSIINCHHRVHRHWLLKSVPQQHPTPSTKAQSWETVQQRITWEHLPMEHMPWVLADCQYSARFTQDLLNWCFPVSNSDVFFFLAAIWCWDFWCSPYQIMSHRPSDRQEL